MKSSSRLASSILFPALLLGAANAPAEELDFAVTLSRMKITLEEAGHAVPVTVERAGASGFQYTGPVLQFGMWGGYAALPETDFPLTAGMKPHGFYAGMGVRGEYPASGRLRGTLGGGYTYQSVEDDLDGQQVTFEWHEFTARAGLTVLLGAGLRLSLGGDYGRIDGERRAYGPVRETVSIETGPEAGAFAALDFDTGDGGHVGASMHQGLRDGFEIYFQRWF